MDEPNHCRFIIFVLHMNFIGDEREKMLRGYVRMQAEANEVRLSGELAPPKQHMRIANSRTGHYGPSIPEGVKLSGERSRRRDREEEEAARKEKKTPKE